MDKNKEQNTDNNHKSDISTKSSCCTCGKYEIYDEKRQAILECCSRLVCQDCINECPRRAHYCHFCQLSFKPSSPIPLRQQLLECSSFSPPAYELPPAYDSLIAGTTQQNLCETEKKDSIIRSVETDNLLHFLDHKNDTLVSLSFRYGVPLPLLRRVNNLTSDHLFSARRTILIPIEYCKDGLSLSPRPIEGEEKERENTLIRRCMIACKISEYDVARLYLEQACFDLEAAIKAFKDDAMWEKEHPLQIKTKGKEKRTREMPPLPPLSFHLKF